MSLTLPVEFVSETAFIAAYCRALETDRPDAHFRDPHARTLAGTRGEQLLQRFPGGESGSAGCIVRTCLIDELILKTIQEGAIDTVVNLGAGLDTRPYRLRLPSSMRWIEVDCAEVLDYKSRKLEGIIPACQLEAIPLDAANRDERLKLFGDIGITAKTVLVITEGLLVYLKSVEVASLARDLDAWPPCRSWVCDLVSPHVLRLAGQLSPAAPESNNVKMHFAPENGAEVFREFGWEAAECRWSLEEGRRLERRFLPDALLAELSKEQCEVLRKLNSVVMLTRVIQDESEK